MGRLSCCMGLYVTFPGCGFLAGARSVLSGYYSILRSTMLKADTLNAQNRKFWDDLKPLLAEFMEDPVVMQAAMNRIGHERKCGMPVRFQTTFEKALLDAGALSRATEQRQTVARSAQLSANASRVRGKVLPDGTTMNQLIEEVFLSAPTARTKVLWRKFVEGLIQRRLFLREEGLPSADAPGALVYRMGEKTRSVSFKRFANVVAGLRSRRRAKQ
jgi:hypothetical protein